jgi:hypothetical protein
VRVVAVAGMPRWTARCRRITVTASSIAARSASLVWSRSPWMRVMSRRILVISCWLGWRRRGPSRRLRRRPRRVVRGCGAGRRGGRSGRAGRTRRCGSGHNRRSGTGPGRRRRRPARWMVRCTARRGRRPHRRRTGRVRRPAEPRRPARSGCRALPVPRPNLGQAQTPTVVQMRQFSNDALWRTLSRSYPAPAYFLEWPGHPPAEQSSSRSR